MTRREGNYIVSYSANIPVYNVNANSDAKIEEPEDSDFYLARPRTVVGDNFAFKVKYEKMNAKK